MPFNFVLWLGILNLDHINAMHWYWLGIPNLAHISSN